MACLSYDLTPLPKRHRACYPTPEEQIQEMKQEIRDTIKPLRDKLDALECELLAEVDRLGALQISERVELNSKLNIMKIGRTNLEKTNKSLVVKSSIDLAIKDLDRKINEVSQELNQFQEMSSSWNTAYWYGKGLLSNTISTLCTLSNVIITESVYKSKSIPKWQIIHGSGPSQLVSPNGICIQADTNHIFVSDSKGKRIQVFSETGDLFKLIDTITNPLQVFFVNESYIYGFIKAGNNSKVILTEVNLFDLTKRTIDYSSVNSTDIKFANYYSPHSKVFICYYLNSHTHYSRIKATIVNNWKIGRFFENGPKNENPNVSAIPNLALTTDSNMKDRIFSGLVKPIKPLDITVHGETIYLLVTNNDYLVLEFNGDLELLHSICPSSLLGAPRAICVDKEDNIIVAGHGEDEIVTRILILSIDGEFIHEIIISCNDCIGIAVNSNLNLFVLNNDTNYPLTAI